MLEKIKFINHINETMEWGKNGIYVNYNDLHDYSWNFASDNNKISSFDKGIVKKSIPLIIRCDSEEKGALLRNQLMEIAEKDVLAMEHGKLMIGDYYLKCYITGSKKKKYLINKGYMEVALTVTTDYPQWVKESTVSFRADGSVVTDEAQDIGDKRNLDYNYDFPYDFISEITNRTLNNTGFVGTNFEMIIYGPCTNPVVFIAGHAYQVSTEISDNEYLTINSLTKTILLTKYDGQIENCFNDRNRNSYIFQPVPAGDNIVTWNNEFGFDVILLEERSEPKWT